MEKSELAGKVDTAAGLSAIPLSLALEMRLPSAGSTDNLRTFDLSIPPRSYPKFRTELFIPQWGWQILTVVACQRDDILLGRDICKNMLLLADWRSGAFGMRPAKPIHTLLKFLFYRFRKVSDA